MVDFGEKVLPMDCLGRAEVGTHTITSCKRKHQYSFFLLVPVIVGIVGMFGTVILGIVGMFGSFG